MPASLCGGEGPRGSTAAAVVKVQGLPFIASRSTHHNALKRTETRCARPPGLPAATTQLPLAFTRHHARTVDTHIANLRKKLATARPDAADPIATVRGVGYVLTEPSDGTP